MADEPSTPDEPPETEGEKKVREESESNRKWLKAAQKKVADDAASERTPLNRNNFGRILVNKPKPSPPPETKK